MFRDVEVVVVVGDSVTFQFPRPLSVEMLAVANDAGEVFWEFIAEEFQPVPVEGGTFRSWKLDEAPPEILALLAQVNERLEREFQEHGPRKPPLVEIAYGKLPPGYRDKGPPRPLVPGEHTIMVSAEQGQGGARFVVSNLVSS